MDKTNPLSSDRNNNSYQRRNQNAKKPITRPKKVSTDTNNHYANELAMNSILPNTQIGLYQGLKLPGFHILNELNIVLNNISKFNRTFDVIYDFFTIQLRMTVSQSKINDLSNDLIKYIYSTGRESDIKRKLGNTWERRITETVWHDFLSGIYFIDRAQKGTIFWNDSRDHFGPDSVMTLGTFNMVNIFAQRRPQITLGSSASLIEANSIFYGIDHLFNYAELEFGETFSIWKNDQFRNSKQYGVMRMLNSVLNGELKTTVPSFVRGDYTICIGDLLTEPLASTENSVGKQILTDPVVERFRVLKSEGVSSTSLALNLIIRTHIDPLTRIFKSIDIQNALYYEYDGVPVAELRRLQTEIWFGIHFTQGVTVDYGFSNPNPGFSPESGSGPNGPTGSDSQGGSFGDPYAEVNSYVNPSTSYEVVGDRPDPSAPPLIPTGNILSTIGRSLPNIGGTLLRGALGALLPGSLGAVLDFFGPSTDPRITAARRMITNGAAIQRDILSRQAISRNRSLA